MQQNHDKRLGLSQSVNPKAAMRNLSDTIARLAARNVMPQGSAPVATRLSPLPDFGSNPGQLKGWCYVPEALPAGAPLVVVLHGCTQTAAGYDQGSGWSELAEREGFALLYPEQQRANNPNLCFNWFVPGDISRDGGEALSIRQMISRMIADLEIDPARVFVTGLSAGGAMTSVMLATYPDLFAGGAVIAGLPFGCAATMPEAFDRMRGAGLPADAVLASRVQAAAAHDGRWPLLSVWHGTADATVALANMDALVGQWRALQDLPVAPSGTEQVHGHTRRIWSDGDGKPRIEAFTIAGMGHGTPIAPHARGGGTAMPYMLDVGISSTDHIAAFWGIAELQASPDVASPAAAADRPIERHTASTFAASVPTGVAKTIDDALRSAGLVR
jgi:poly(hydroxyalkanoate) depolymerase family esterase